MLSFSRLCRATVPAILIAATASANAQQYPTRAIRVISPYPAGSASDTVTRVVIDQVSKFIGQPVVIEMRPGAGGSIGFSTVAKSDPDGYTLVTSSSSMATESVLHKTLPYDPVRDFVPVVLIGTSPNLLVASAQSGFKTVADLVAAAKAKPGTLTFASAGNRLLLPHGRRAIPSCRQHRRPPRTVPGRWPYASDGWEYRLLFHSVGGGRLGAGKRQARLAGGQLTETRRALAERAFGRRTRLSRRRLSFFWNGISAPAKTPRDIVNKLHDVAEIALKDSALREKLAKLGVEPAQMSVEEFGKFFRDDLNATVELAKKADVRPLD